MTDMSTVSQQEVLDLINNTGRAIWTYMKYLILGALLLIASKSYAMNLWTRMLMLISQEQGTRKDDIIEKRGRFYRIVYISWFKGKVKFINIEDKTDELLQEIQSYWKNEILIKKYRETRKKK